MRLRLIGFLLACLSFGCLLGDASNAAESVIGQKVQSFALPNAYGKEVSLDDFTDRKCVAIVFLGTECPLVKLYGPRLNDLQAKFGEDGLQVIGVNSNKQDSLTEVAAYVHRHEITFPMLKDKGNVVADAMGAQRTPEVFLVDADRVVRYHGRIDDQYGVGYSRDKKTHSDLAIAVKALLAGDEIAQPETEAVGCHIGRVKKIAETGEVTFSKHIAPIFHARCVSCHREGEIAPFTLTSYEDVLGWEDTILEVIDDNRMPPWSANPDHGEFANDARLSAEERSLIEQWVDGGMPEGDPNDLPALPKFTAGWQIGEPDQVIQMRDKPFTVPAEGVLDYQRFVVDPGWTEDKFVVACEARPQNRSVVHHILVFVIPPNGKRVDLQKVLVGYAPGSTPLELNDGIAIHVQAGSKLLFEMHYTPNGTVQEDLSYIGVKFTQRENVAKELKGAVAINTRFRIPPGEANHVVTAAKGVNSDKKLLSMTPHMHLRGKAFRYVARFPDGTEEILLDVPRYDFNWQIKYILKEPRLIPKGTSIHCRAVFDNSEYNLSNPDPSKTVGWGEQSWDEMMIGFMDYVDAD
ncbi:thioredoxin family protein [Rhodopirellula sp. JC740]|uniref:Thioredoxin family protein n=1 Tax=Rhodopirellula halodulae TaxID=2894198 RepID=A0ABS8NJK6_9BACT|nr:redoxin domain-containing protein [Rhodopirellula sp. JC740]MCC9643758.1 thioredoxin family protein [Rhodopirellula sp. JC740]